MKADFQRHFKFGPILTATVLTVLGIWLFKTVAQVFVLLMLGILASLYLGAVAGWIRRHLHAPERVALAFAIFGSLGALVLLAYILVPPVIDQARQLVQQMPNYINSWETGIDSLANQYPALRAVIGDPGEHRTVQAIYGEISGTFSTIPTKVFEIVHAAINIFAVGVMGIYLAVHPALYREWLIALFPPIHRDLVRDVLSDCASSLRAYIVGLLLTMTFLGTLTAVGLYVLGVPYYVTFGVFTGLATIVPFFGTLLATTLPALFALTGPHGGTRALWVIALGVFVHLVEGNFVSPYIMSRQVDLPPVLTIVFVLIVGTLLGPLGLLVAVPGLAVIMVIVRRILLSRIYEGHGFRRTARERPLRLRLPATEGGVIVPRSYVDIVSALERRTIAAPV